MKKTTDPLHVVKKLSPQQAGAIKLARKYGDALLCVRYRHDREGTHRITTVELIVDRTPIQRRPGRSVEILIDFDDQAARRLALAAGAKWDGEEKVWRMSEAAASRLGWLVADSKK